MRYFLTLCIAFHFFQGFSQADSTKLKFDLSLRYRYEAWNGMNAKNYGDDSYTAIGEINDNLLYQRVIAGFIAEFSEKLTLAAHLQDSRAFGWSLRNSRYPDLFNIKAPETSSPYYRMNPQEEYFEIYDCFAEYRNILPNLTLKAGRQKIFYGDYHMLGPGDWGNTGRWTWDAVKISYKKDENFVELFAGGTKIHDPGKLSVPFMQTEFWGGGLYAHLGISSFLKAEPFYVFKAAGSADYMNTLKINRHWAGFRVFNNDFHSFIFDGLLVKEFGNENGKRISSYGFFLKAGYQFHTIPLKPLLSIRESYASGGKKSDAKIHTYDPAFGAGDKFYGWMNITTWSNLDDREIVLELFPIKNIWIEIKCNRFYIPVPDDVVLLSTMKLTAGQHHLGDEFDIFIRYQANKKWQFTGAFGYFIIGDVEPINGLEPKDTKWFALQVLFVL